MPKINAQEQPAIHTIRNITSNFGTITRMAGAVDACYGAVEPNSAR